MANIITVLIILIVLVTAISYIIREKKKGTKCIGCPSAGTCVNKSRGCKSNCES